MFGDVLQSNVCISFMVLILCSSCMFACAGTAAAAVMRGGSQNFSIKAAANGDYINNFGTGDIVCNREFFTMTEDRPIVKEVSLLSSVDVLLHHVQIFMCRMEPYWVFLSLVTACSATASLLLTVAGIFVLLCSCMPNITKPIQPVLWKLRSLWPMFGVCFALY